MAKGDGSIQQLGRNKWRISVSLGSDPVTKKQRRITKVVYGSKAEARAVRDRIRQEAEAGVKVDVDLTYGELFDKWVEAKRAEGAANDETIAGYIAKHKRILNAIGTVSARKLDASSINALFAKLREETELSGSTLHAMFVIMKSVFQLGVDSDYLRKNPAASAKSPRNNDRADMRNCALSEADCARFKARLDVEESEAYAERNRIEAYHDENQPDRKRRFLHGIHDISRIIGVRLAFATGMRLGEVLALTWEHVDLKEERLEVVAALDGNGKPKAPKTSAGRRTVALDSDTAQHLRKWKQDQKRYFARIGVTLDDSTPVVCSDVAGYDDKPNFGSWWQSKRKSMGFADLNLHRLRHTAATRLLAAGVDVTTVQTRLGHADPSITFGWYSHPDQERDDKAADLMGEIMAGTTSKAVRIVKFRTAS